jgi:hypothetical protein
MPQKRFIPALAKNATQKAKEAEVWIVFDTRTKKPWADHRNVRSNWFDVSLACDTLNSREK